MVHSCSGAWLTSVLGRVNEQTISIFSSSSTTFFFSSSSTAGKYLLNEECCRLFGTHQSSCVRPPWSRPLYGHGYGARVKVEEGKGNRSVKVAEVRIKEIGSGVIERQRRCYGEV